MALNTNVTPGTRIGSMVMDHFIITFGGTVLSIPFMIPGMLRMMKVSHEPEDFGMMNGPMMYAFMLLFCLYFCKDCINGRSFAKRIVKLQVVRNDTGEVASPLRCFIRDLFCVIWPIEVIATVINPARRIGDFVAGTKVVNYDPASVQQPKVDFARLLIPVVISFGAVYLMMLPLQNINSHSPKVPYEKSSYNAEESKALEKVYNDSLGQYLAADVRVYNKIDNQSGKYISIIFHLKEDMMGDKSTSNEFKQTVLKQLNATFPEGSYTGQVQYVYETSTRKTIHREEIGASKGPVDED